MALVRNFKLGSGLLFHLLNARAFRSSSSSMAYRHRPAFFHKAGTCIGNASFTFTALSASTSTDEVAASATKSVPVNGILSDNPLLRSWDDQPFNLPPFKSINPSHFQPALESAMEAQIRELETIASSTPDFESILGAYDRAGALYSRVGSVYGNYISSLNTPDMQVVQTTMAPILSRHRSKCYNIPGLFEKMELMHDMREEMLAKGEWNAEQVRLAERIYTNFVRMGAKFDEVSTMKFGYCFCFKQDMKNTTRTSSAYFYD